MPLPNVKNKKPAIAVLINWRLVILVENPNTLAMTNISVPAVVNRMEANIKGGNSPTAILLNKYVEPQTT